MFFKKKKKVTWKKKGDSFYVYINHKEVPARILNCWVGSSLLIYLETLDKNFLLQGYEKAPDEEEFEAEFVAEGQELLWLKDGEGYNLFERGIAVNEQSVPFWLDDLFLLIYNGKVYFLPNYKNVKDLVLQIAEMINDEQQVTWVKKDKHFYLLAGTLLNLNHDAHCCNDDLIVYVDDLQANMLLQNYYKSKDETFYETYRLAEKDELIYRKIGKSNFSLFFNELDLSADTVATFINDDVLVYLPKINYTLLFQNFRNDSGEDYHQPQILGNENTAFWSADSSGFYLIDKGDNISPEVSKNNSRIGDHLLLYHPQTTSTYLFENYQNLKDGENRPAKVISRSAQFVWKAYDNQFWLWYQGKRVGECENQMIGNDLMVMPKSLKILVKLKDFANCQDNKLRTAEST